MVATERRKGGNLCKQATALASQCHRMGVCCWEMCCACWHHAFLPGQTLDTVLPTWPLDCFWEFTKRLWCQFILKEAKKKRKWENVTENVLKCCSLTKLNRRLSIVYWTLGARRSNQSVVYLAGGYHERIFMVPVGFYHLYSAPFFSPFPVICIC